QRESSAQLQLRVVIDAELQKCLTIHEAATYWQDRLHRPLARLRLWLEAGPFLWFPGLSLAEAQLQAQTTFDGLCSALLQHEAYVGTLHKQLTAPEKGPAWTDQTRTMIKQWLRHSGCELDELDELDDLNDLDLGARIVAAATGWSKEDLLGERLPPGRLRRSWWWIAALMPFAGACAFLWSTDYAQQVKRRVLRGGALFTREHVQEPYRALINELGGVREPITDLQAMKDTNESLKRMLRSFVNDTMPDISKEEVDRIADQMDMSAVSRQYEKSIVKAVQGVLTGDLIRMMLIQIQHLKKEIQATMGAIEDLMDENEFNLRVMATAPAILLARVAYVLFRDAYYAVTKEKSRPKSYAFIRDALHELERFLNLLNRSRDRHLDERELGRAAFLLYQIRMILWEKPRYGTARCRRANSQSVLFILSLNSVLCQGMRAYQLGNEQSIKRWLAEA
ncbi:unnamed protein product, partial [Chrysoparadoxa australica]